MARVHPARLLRALSPSSQPCSVMQRTHYALQVNGSRRHVWGACEGLVTRVNACGVDGSRLYDGSLHHCPPRRRLQEKQNTVHTFYPVLLARADASASQVRILQKRKESVSQLGQRHCKGGPAGDGSVNLGTASTLPSTTQEHPVCRW